MDDPTPTPIEKLPNIGPKSARVLRSVGIGTVGDLERVGCVAAYVRARHVWEGASLNLLWSLAAGMKGVSWTQLGPEEKAALHEEARGPQPSCAGEMFTIQCIPNLSVSEPYTSPQNCFASGISIEPPSASCANQSANVS